MKAFATGLAAALLLAAATGLILDYAAISSVEATDGLSVIHKDEIEGWFIADPET